MSYFMGEFSRLRDYVKSELTNPNTLQQANNPTYAPSMTIRRGVKTVGYASTKGSLNWMRDNKLNRRGKKQFDKYKSLFAPPQITPVGQPVKKKRFEVF